MDCEEKENFMEWEDVPSMAQKMEESRDRAMRVRRAARQKSSTDRAGKQEGGKEGSGVIPDRLAAG